MAAAAKFTAEVWLWDNSDFPIELEDLLTEVFEDATAFLKKRLHEVEAVKEVRCDF